MAEETQHNICEEKLFNNIFRTHSKDLFNFLYYKFGAANNPQDLVQEAFTKLWENCHKVFPEKARSYLFTVANNLMINELNKKKTVLTHRQLLPISSKVETPEFVFEEKEYMNKLQKALEELPEAQRVAFLLNRVEGKKHQEIADMLGISRKGVEKRIYSAVSKLKEKLGKI